MLSSMCEVETSKFGLDITCPNMESLLELLHPLVASGSYDMTADILFS
jgi:hypothetical protein